MTDAKKPAPLRDDDLNTAAGGGHAGPPKWKGFNLKGNGTTAATQGGFSDVSGLGAEVQIAEYREGETIRKR